MVMTGRPGLAGDEQLLAPADTSSPRATLSSFLGIIDAIHADLVNSPPSLERRERTRRRIAKVGTCLDLSAVAPSLVESKRQQAAVNLKEVLDRIELPAPREIPDADFVAAEKLDRWRLPGTEITIVRLRDGPRAGEWAFSSDTVGRAEGFYSLVKHLPYRADAGSPGLHELYVAAPGWMIPPALIHGMPVWASRRFWEVAVWQWVAAGLLLAVGLTVVTAAFAVARRSAGRPGFVPGALTLAAPLVLIGTCLALDTVLTQQVRITGDVLFVVKTALRVGIFGGCVVIVQEVLTRVGEALIRSRRLRPGTVDTQLVRLGFQILSVLATTWMVIQAADSMGISVTPLIAGLGVGGLAVALAAQHTIENLIAGLVLFADKPVRIGDACQFGEHRGTVEQIGLRSTRIRALDRTIISIPNSEFAKLRLINFARRDRILLKTMLGLRYETSADQLRHLLASLRQLLEHHPRIDSSSVRVRFVGYGAYSLDVELFALAETTDWSTFLVIQEDVFLAVMDVVTESGCSFALPSQTHYMASDAGVDQEARRRAEARINDLRNTGGLPAAGFLDCPPNASPTVVDSAQRLQRPAA
ncbi:MAG: hypothetical protein RLZZ440_985 [Planctomycetota bacterium]